MELFDSHIHSEGRSVEDLAKMSEHGIKHAVSCAFYPIKPLFAETLMDLFRKLIEYESKRGEKAGMNIYAAIGIHPRCIPREWDKVLKFMEEVEGYIAFGEIGLEEASKEEVEVFKDQLKLAKKLDVPCIIHTPRRNKEAVTEKIFEILERLEFPEDLCLIDHANAAVAEKALKKGYHVGLTVQPGKLSVEDAVDIVYNFGDEYFIANSDTGFSESDFLAVYKLWKELKNEKVLLKNAKKFFRI